MSFRGICLFTIKDGLLRDVLLPEAEDSKPREHKRGFHVDNTEARDHFAGMLLPSDLRKKLKRADVTIEEEDADAPPDAGPLDTLPNLSNLGLELERDDRKMATVTVKGGTITTEPANIERAFEFLDQGVRHDQVDIIFTKRVTIKVRGATLSPLDPATNPTVYIYNFDDDDPDRTTLEKGLRSDDIIIRDDDFKWHFLLVAPPGDDPRKLERWTLNFDGFLPCPKSLLDSGPHPETIAGSTCYPATFTE